MIEAFGWGLVGASALALGCTLALRFRLPTRLIGYALAFASGVLISAVAFELVSEAVEHYHAGGAAVGLFTGSLAFYAGDRLIRRRTRRKRLGSAGEASSSGSLPIVLGTVLDSLPESLVLGLTLIEGSNVLTILVAIWLANLPEAAAGTNGLLKEGWKPSRIFLLWAGIIAASAAASALGHTTFAETSEETKAFVLAFAGGAVLTMLADSMIPDAYEDAGPLVGVVTTFGFATAYLIQSLE